VHGELAGCRASCSHTSPTGSHPRRATYPGCAPTGVAAGAQRRSPAGPRHHTPSGHAAPDADGITQVRPRHPARSCHVAEPAGRPAAASYGGARPTRPTPVRAVAHEHVRRSTTSCSRRSQAPRATPAEEVGPTSEHQSSASARRHRQARLAVRRPATSGGLVPGVKRRRWGSGPTARTRSPLGRRACDSRSHAAAVVPSSIRRAWRVRFRANLRASGGASRQTPPQHLHAPRRDDDRAVPSDATKHMLREPVGLVHAAATGVSGVDAALLRGRGAAAGTRPDAVGPAGVRRRACPRG